MCRSSRTVIFVLSIQRGPRGSVSSQHRLQRISCSQFQGRKQASLILKRCRTWPCNPVWDSAIYQQNWACNLIWDSVLYQQYWACSPVRESALCQQELGIQTRLIFCPLLLIFHHVAKHSNLEQEPCLHQINVNLFYIILNEYLLFHMFFPLSFHK